jgi:hypothetical protein
MNSLQKLTIFAEDAKRSGPKGIPMRIKFSAAEGGVLVSEAEKATLAEISSALRLAA